MSGKRRALLVATETYQDSSFAQLRAPSRDVEALAGVLQDPDIGGFDVDTLLDRPRHEVEEAIESFFEDGARDDLNLLYFSGHGIKDRMGRLCFGMTNTRLANLRSTGVSATFVNDVMRESLAHRKVLILDCCYAGAFAKGMPAKGGKGVGLADCFHDGRGHVVLTASDAMQYSFESGGLSGSAEPSVFTKVLVQGLSTGEADIDEDGYVSIDDLYEYMHRGVTAQRPQKWVFGIEGTLHLARNPKPRAVPLPEHIERLLNDSHASVRRLAPQLLGELLTDPHPGLVLAARSALSLLRDDDSRQVSRAAREVLGAEEVLASPAVPRRPAASRASRSVVLPTHPSWAVGGGEDEFGRWADIDLHGAVARLRWIEPGTFSMGSPETEEGRDDDELQHQVTLTQGYWLAETPVTQAQWKAVMGANPSRFVSPDRPVEQVSWDDAQGFLGKLNTARNDLSLRLPTEAEWEYACRAGTTTSTYAGELKILGDRNGPVLDEIAWYGGNSGVDFDLEAGADSSGWSKKQYPHKKAGTRLVKQKRPNLWGLYDMLGNVWEWCSDWFGAYEGGPVSDPSGVSEGSERAIRGGSWINYARLVRAASRDRHTPEFRPDYLGFRIARGQG